LISAENGVKAAAMFITGTGGSGVTSFNGRTGAVTLTSTDVTTAIGTQAPLTVFAGPATNSIASLGTVVGGSGYTNGSYSAVPLTGGIGSGATANITVAGGVVTTATLVAAGTGYEADDILSASSTNIGGTGGGFQVAINLNTIANAVPVFRPLTAADIPELDAGLF